MIFSGVCRMLKRKLREIPWAHKNAGDESQTLVAGKAFETTHHVFCFVEAAYHYASQLRNRLGLKFRANQAPNI